MRRCMWIPVMVTMVIGLASGASAQDAKTAAADAALVKALTSAMDPGEGQKKLDFLVGTFDVKVRTWVDPAKPPFESTATAVATWVLGNRYVQQMLAGYVMGEPWSGIGYAGFDNTTKTYVATFMDSGSTGMEWYTGTLDAAGKVGKLTATVHDELTGKPLPVEMRLAVAPNGDHVTEMWQGDLTGKLAKVMELQYTRRKP
jgi:hypothetical protein